MGKISQAFVLGAGLGTRLRPLTEEFPKPLITFALDHLIHLGIDKIFINTHRLPETFAAAFPDNLYSGLDLTFVNEPVLLETGGGIKNIEAQLGREPFITYSGDVLTDVPLQPLIDEHFSRGNDVTLALRKTDFGSAILPAAGAFPVTSTSRTSRSGIPGSSIVFPRRKRFPSSQFSANGLVTAGKSVASPWTKANGSILDRAPSISGCTGRSRVAG